ncbi:hypothetical protein CISIN_1g028306mg [Citrus sinensis]|uniref:Thiol-disulfide oxidoreductase DCC n=1 Tax=Citrus sinensis TaxID=2711 RepID=A0A067GSG6_CITSI|nr:hypothetical protein CISIN_1g028306mg [Citrus sinensis]
MLIRQARNFSKAYAAPLSSSLKTLFPSPADVVPGVAADVADVTGADDLVYTEPPVSSTVKPAMEPSLLQPGVVIYDGVCHLCHGGVKWVIRADKYRKIKFCCLQSQAAEPYLRLCGLDREDVLRRFLFVEGPGLYHQASTGMFSNIIHVSTIFWLCPYYILCT